MTEEGLVEGFSARDIDNLAPLVRNSVPCVAYRHPATHWIGYFVAVQRPDTRWGIYLRHKLGEMLENTLFAGPYTTKEEATGVLIMLHRLYPVQGVTT